MLNCGASHNLVPKFSMDQLELQVTRPYHGLYTFESKKVACHGLIKVLVVTLAQIPIKSVVLHTVVTYIPPKCWVWSLFIFFIQRYHRIGT